MTPKYLRYQLELLVAFAVCEGLLRRALPSLGTPILAFKFIFTVWLLGVAWLRYDVPRFVFRGLPPPLLIYAAYGTLLTLANLADETVARIVGIAVNVLFLPLIALAIQLYADVDRLRALLQRFAILVVATCLLAFYQSTLPASHWLVMEMDSGSAFGIGGGLFKVSSSFQFCNIFAAFLVVSLAAMLTALLLARTFAQRLAYAATVALALATVTLTGSRMGSFGCLLVIAIVMLPAVNVAAVRQRLGRLVLPALLAVATAVVGLAQTDFGARTFDKIAGYAATRSLKLSNGGASEGSLLFLGYYFHSRLIEALEVGEGIGTGWGVYTMGVNRFRREQTNINIVEGGSATILAETGLPGLCLFGAFVMYLFFYRAIDRRFRPYQWGVAAAFALTSVTIPIAAVSSLFIPWAVIYGALVGAAAPRQAAVRATLENDLATIQPRTEGRQWSRDASRGGI